MNWIQSLCKSYDDIINTCYSENTPLIPIGFTQKKIKYHVVIDENGEFKSANELSDDESECIIPSTPQAEARTGDSAIPFPLVEQLKYFVCDGEENPRLSKYLEQLSLWCEQSDAPECLRILKNYLEKGTLLQDLIKAGVNVKYHKDNEKKDGKGNDSKEFVCFSVWDKTLSSDNRLWKRRDVRESWSRYIVNNSSKDYQLCYAEGRKLSLIDNHPKVQGNAKLISAKDAEYPFLYRGRFVDERSAAGVSYEASKKAHNVLNWLIDRQGFCKYGMTIVAWNTEGSKMSLPIEDNYDEDDEDEGEKYADTFEKTSKNIRNAGLGYESVSEDCDAERMKKVMILGLEAATDGRMSVIYYQELEGNDYIEKLNEWYSKCKWLLYKNREKGWIEGTPTPEQISQAVMGVENVKIAKKDLKCEKSATKQMRQLRMRLLRCIVDGVPISRDMVQSAFVRVISPQSFNRSDGSWSRFMWKSNMAVACALISKLFDQQGVVVTHELDTKCTRRDYLYGRLLAVADIIECSSMGLPKDYQSSAVRYMQRFVQQPAEIWKKIYLRLIPYLGRLKGYASYYQYLIGQIESLFDKEDRLSRKSLSYDFLCGYFSQQQKLMEKKDKTAQSDMYKDSDTVEVEPLKEYQFPIDRDGLYGCLLAVADVVEYRALGEDYRGSTNALRLMESFSLRPVETWKNIHSRMLPYLEKKPDSFYQYCLSQIESRFMEEERENNTGLNKNFIYEYSRMRWALLHKNMPKLDMGIAEKNVVMTRDIAYGRLLKIENLIESKVLGKIEDENKRQTNAIRWMAEFSKKPSSVWKNVLRQKLKPYERKEKWLMANKYSKQLEILETCIYGNGWDTDEPLSGMYLYGFYANFNDDFCDIEGR